MRHDLGAVVPVDLGGQRVSGTTAGKVATRHDAIPPVYEGGQRRTSVVRLMAARFPWRRTIGTQPGHDEQQAWRGSHAHMGVTANASVRGASAAKVETVQCDSASAISSTG
jgi:hypothetical protein